MANLQIGKKDGIEYIYTNNFMLGSNPLSGNSFNFRYKSPQGKVYEDKVVPSNPENQDTAKAVHDLWFILHEAMKRAKPGEDINPFKFLNRNPFRQKTRLESEPEQLEMKLASVKVVLSYLKSSCGIEMISFSDEIANLDIPADDAQKVIYVYNEMGADSEHSCASITGIDAYTCKAILDAAHKRGLLK